MAEYIGARISLISKADIRYVGTLHKINSTDATVALENVTSFGTEGRKDNPAEEIGPMSGTYDYIVFRGSDVKDLRIDEVPAVKETPPPPPNDPAILQGYARPPPQAEPQRQQPITQQAPPQGPQQVQSPQGGPPFPHHAQYPPPFYPPPQGWGRGGPPPGPGGFPPMPYGGQPWYPGQGQGFPPGPFPPSPYGYPPGPPGHFQHGPPPPQQQQPPKPSPIGPSGSKTTPPAVQPTEKPNEKSTASKSLPKATEPTASELKGPTPPVESKPSPTEVAVAVAQVPTATRAAAENATSSSGRVAPALPRSGQPVAASPKPVVPKQYSSAPGPSVSQPDKLTAATQAATAAVAAAMAKMPPVSRENGNALEDLTNKVQQMRTTDRAVRAPAQPGRGAGFSRGPRGGARGGLRGANPAPTVELPGSDFDFDSANAKFNKEDLVKEAIAGSPLVETGPAASPTEPTTTSVYNKASSFFDNISSDSKDRMEAANTRGGRVWRGEEQKKNVQTFGEGSVDNGYRGGYRGGRGRGRGRGGYRGRGYSGNGQPRGGSGYQGNAETAA